jgi:hypothetical protein
MWFLSQLAPWIALDLKGGDVCLISESEVSGDFAL